MRKTYAPNAIIIGILVGILVAVKVNAILGVLAGLGISVLGWVLISSLERAADRAGDALDDAIRKKLTRGKTKNDKKKKRVIALLFADNFRIEGKKNDYYSEIGEHHIMKKRFLCIALVLCLILGICGCGSSSGSDSTLADSAPAEDAASNDAADIVVDEIQNDNYSEPEIITNEKHFDENTVREERNASTESNLNFDGLYCHIGDFNSNGLIDNYVLMFYEDGSVINVTVEQTEDCGGYFPKKKWFSKDADRYKDLHGQYIIDGTDISFTTISEDGTVDYWGTIENNKLLLSSHSNINGHDDYKEYIFYSFDEIPEWE